MNTNLIHLTEEPNPPARGRRAPRLRWASLAAAALAGLLAVGIASAQDTATTQPAPPAGAGLVPAPGVGPMQMTVGQNKVITMPRRYTKILVSQTDVVVATALPPADSTGPRDILLTAKKPGSTQLLIWDDQNHAKTIDITVENDLGTLRPELARIFPDVKIDVSSANGMVVLKGRVPNVVMADQIMKVAEQYSPKPINLMEVSGGQQVVLQVRFAEVSRSLQANLGFNVFASDGTFKFGIQNAAGDNPIGGLFKGSNGTPTIPSNATVFGSGQFGNTALEYFVQALNQNGLLRWLAEPNVMAISGQTADFNAGGSFPYPVPQPGSGGSAITIQFQNYGVELKFTPVVLGDGRIRLNVAPDVSELDYTNAVTVAGVSVPGLTERKLNTTVELGDGQTLALAGLLQRQVSATASMTPILGDLPILGALFRSVSYQDNDSELVVLVTPHLVGAMNPGEVPSIPGEKWRYPTEAQLFVNHDLGGPQADTKNGPHTQPTQFYGPYGFAPATTPADAASATAPAQ